MTTLTDVKVAPLSDVCGAEISGVDLSQPLDGTTVDAILEAWRKHLVLVIRGQDVTLESQLRFAGYFG